MKFMTRKLDCFQAAALMFFPITSKYSNTASTKLKEKISAKPWCMSG